MVKEYITKCCIGCGSPLTKTQKYYCSYRCNALHNNPNPKKPKLKKICLTCNIPFFVHRSLNRIKYCTLTCRRHTANTKNRISNSKKEWYKYNLHPRGMLGKKAWNRGLKGIHFSPQTEFQSGDKHYNWKGGKSKEPYPFEFTKDLKSYIIHLYHCQCQLCFTSKDLVVHHKDFNKNNLYLYNLINLCRSCNTKVNFNREIWMTILEKHLIIKDKIKPYLTNVGNYWNTLGKDITQTLFKSMEIKK